MKLQLAIKRVICLCRVLFARNTLLFDKVTVRLKWWRPIRLNNTNTNVTVDNYMMNE